MKLSEQQACEKSLLTELRLMFSQQPSSASALRIMFWSLRKHLVKTNLVEHAPYTCCRRRYNLALPLLLLAVVIFLLIFCHATVKNNVTSIHLVMKTMMSGGFLFAQAAPQTVSITGRGSPKNTLLYYICNIRTCAGNIKPYLATRMAPHNIY